MKVVYKDLWDIYAALKPDEYICITTNGSIRRDGCAVMGRGCAYEATQKFPDIQKKLGGLLAKNGNHVFHFPEYKLFTFPVKTTWDQLASFHLIQQSCYELVKLLQDNKITTAFLPSPGSGNGRRSPQEVVATIEPVLGAAPVTIVRRPEEKT